MEGNPAVCHVVNTSLEGGAESINCSGEMAVSFGNVFGVDVVSCWWLSTGESCDNGS